MRPVDEQYLSEIEARLKAATAKPIGGPVIHGQWCPRCGEPFGDARNGVGEYCFEPDGLLCRGNQLTFCREDIEALIAEIGRLKYVIAYGEYESCTDCPCDGACNADMGCAASIREAFRRRDKAQGEVKP